MNINLRLLLLGLLCLVLQASACSDDDTPPKPRSTSINQIMPLGASRVEGARPAFESYRYELWKQLTANGWTFDFVGTQSDDASYPAVGTEAFDVDHEGRGGWTSGDIRDGLGGWLERTGPPDVVLFSSPGGNDILDGQDYDQAIANINAIVDALQADNPNVTILIEQPAPGQAAFMTPAFTAAFQQMQDDVVTISAQQTTATSQVIPVDMFTDFDDRHLADEVHYNQAGAELVASRYYNVLKDVLD